MAAIARSLNRAIMLALRLHGEQSARLQGLEERVRVRTAELEAVNRALSAEIAERKRAESTEREARAEAEAANRAKSRFLAAASHDVRQPFQAMRLFYGMLSSRIPASDPSRGVVDRLGDALTNAEALLSALLDVSSLEAGQARPTLIRFPVDDTLQRIADEFHPLAAQRGLDFRYVPTQAWVYSDPVLLGRIVRNFASNAVQYTNRGGVVLGCRPRRDMVMIVVYDTGPGIPSDRREAISEEFVRLDRDTRDAGPVGLGLGLAIAQRTVSLLGHKLHFRTREGRGSAFGVVVPGGLPKASASAA